MSGDIRVRRYDPTVVKHIDGCIRGDGHYGPCARQDTDLGLAKRIVDQPPPQPSKGDLWQSVIDDMVERRKTGIARYGTPLQANNGRDALVDLYQELLDAVVYVRQVMEERKRL